MSLGSVFLPGIVHDGVKSMGDGQHGAVLKLDTNCWLDQGVCFQIHSCRCLIQDKNLGFAEESTSQTYQLTLSQTAEQCIAAQRMETDQDATTTGKYWLEHLDTGPSWVLHYLRFSPPSEHSWFSLSGRPDTKFLRWASSRTLQTSSSEYASNGSRFIRREPENSTGSCGLWSSRNIRILHNKYYPCGDMIVVPVGWWWCGTSGHEVLSLLCWSHQYRFHLWQLPRSEKFQERGRTFQLQFCPLSRPKKSQYRKGSETVCQVFCQYLLPRNVGYKWN